MSDNELKDYSSHAGADEFTLKSINEALGRAVQASFLSNMQLAKEMDGLRDEIRRLKSKVKRTGTLSIGG